MKGFDEFRFTMICAFMVLICYVLDNTIPNDKWLIFSFMFLGLQIIAVIKIYFLSKKTKSKIKEKNE